MMLYCFPLHKPGPKGRHLVPLPVSSEEWDEDEQPLFSGKGYSLTANMRDRFLKVHSLKRHNGEKFILLQVEKCFTIQTNSKDNTLLWIQRTSHSRLTTDLMDGVGEVILPSYMSPSPPQLHLFALQDLQNFLKKHQVKQARSHLNAEVPSMLMNYCSSTYLKV